MASSADAPSPSKAEGGESPPPSPDVPQMKMTYDLNEAQFGRPFVAISGLIGAGKTTLATALGKELGLPIFYEPVIDNVYLTDFYADMAKYSFPLQVFLLNKRFAQQQQIIWSGNGGIQDRSIYEDAVFARMLKNSGLMTERDYDTYLSLFNHMSNFMRKPNVIIHLEVSPEESLERIKSRSRGCETGISLEYLQGLHTAYEEFIADISRVIPVIKVNWSTFQSTEDVARSVREEYLKISAIRHVDFGGDAKANAAAAAAAAAAGPSTAARDAKQGLAPQLSRASPPPAEVPTSS